MQPQDNLKTFISRSVRDTERIAAEIAVKLGSGDIAAFRGGLGAGKTAFVRGAARALGYDGAVSSPTFTVCNEYLSENMSVPLYHFDMYRINTENDLESIGFYDYNDGIVMIEWFENIAGFGIIPRFVINIEINEYDTRIITIEEL
jgi:tRNA threonylcarbamoyladenosine biosynthesis protein TsaE